ncbi:MAG TPA: Holliday junction resolvase RuvX [Nitrospiraceae bacterium]|nr:Holliday junction resolvase RuvX [Nitrospiraceae bacterium]
MSGTRILALDHGTKRIGVALSDELGWTAQPLETYERRTLEADLQHIDRLVREHDVAEVVIGLPLRLNGELGPAARSVQEFVERLAEILTVPVVTWDERMTTKAAEDLLIAADVSRKKRKGVVDRIAAAILLQSYLESRSKPAHPPDVSGEEQRSGDDYAVNPLEDADEEPISSMASGFPVSRRRGGIPGPSMGPTAGR